MILRTCTKINVGLRVLRRRPDGYHDLDTLFVPYYGYGDLLEVEPADSLGISIERAEGVDWDPMQDLTIRAWRLLKADFPLLPEVRIRLEKHAPVGAGLGGGSADAAYMLRALNSIGDLGLDDAALAAYAARLGSDCAFFVYSRPMLGSGRGEVLEAFDIDLSACEIRVGIPLDGSGKPVAVSTREAYAGITPREYAPGEPSLAESLRRPLREWKGLVVNDFEASVCPRHPEIPELIARFYSEGALYAAMSGSGSSVFGIFAKD